MSYIAKTALLSTANLLKYHFTFFFHALNPVKPLDFLNSTTLSSKERVKLCNAKRRSVQRHSAFAILAHFLTLLIGLVGFELYYTGGTFNLEQLASSPYIYCHQFTPASSWAQIDIAFSQDIVASVLLYIVLIRRPEIGSSCADNKGRQRWVIYNQNWSAIWIDSKQLTSDESKDVLAFMRTVNRILMPLMTVYYVYEIFALLSQVWLNDVYEVSILMAVFWIVAVPSQMFYLFNCKEKYVKLDCKTN